jgi:hypothetical protein
MQTLWKDWVKIEFLTKRKKSWLSKSLYIQLILEIIANNRNCWYRLLNCFQFSIPEWIYISEWRKYELVVWSSPPSWQASKRSSNTNTPHSQYPTQNFMTRQQIIRVTQNTKPLEKMDNAGQKTIFEDFIWNADWQLATNASIQKKLHDQDLAVTMEVWLTSSSSRSSKAMNWYKSRVFHIEVHWWSGQRTIRKLRLPLKWCNDRRVDFITNEA